MKKKNLKAFTLAEVLITLAIIGVVAAITVPTLIQRTNKQEYVTALQKAYSTLSQATNQIIAENGSPKCVDEGWACSDKGIYELYKRYLNNAKECSTGTGCWSNTILKQLNGNNDYNYDKFPMQKLVLSDGMQLGFGDVSGNCSASNLNGTKNRCARIYLDVNGSKRPNQFGRDIFWFVIKEDGLIPAGCDDESRCSMSSAGDGCACKVLREGAMNY